MISKKKNSIIFGIILFRITLELAYIYILKETYQSLDLVYYLYKLDIDIYKYVLSWITFFVMTVFLSTKILINNNRASDVMILGLFIMSFVPSCSLFGLANLPYQFFLLFMLFWLIFLISLYYFCNKKCRVNFVISNSKMNDSDKKLIYNLIVSAFCIFAFIFSAIYNSLNINLNFQIIYELRAKAREANLSKLIVYALNCSAYIVFPLAAVKFFSQKKWVLFGVICYLQLLLFSIDGQKAIFFIIPTAVAAFLLYKDYMLQYIPKFLVCLNLIAFLEFFINKSTIILQSLIVRLYFLPAMLSYCYYDFFSNNPPVMIAGHTLKSLGLISDYYDTEVAFIIGKEYVNNPNVSANTGLFGSAFSYGILGIIFIPIAYAILFKIFNRVTKYIPIKIYIPIMISLIIAITGVSIFVVITAYGFLLALFILMLLNNKNTIFSYNNSDNYN